MNEINRRHTAIYLLLGVFLMIVTMVLHPVGGNFERLVEVATVGMIAHALAIFSVPFSALGFRGLTQLLPERPFLSRLAFALMFFGLIAAMLAAAVNGLTLPIFVTRYQDATPELIEAIRPILHYNMALNHAFDYILIGAIMFSMLLWSFAMLGSALFPNWLGYLGIMLTLAALIAAGAGFYLLDLHGFRIFIFGWVLWVTGTGGMLLYNQTTEQHPADT